MMDGVGVARTESAEVAILPKRPRQPLRMTALDRHVGMRIRAARMARGMTQGHLADALGVSDGQIDKYERAENRVVVERLHAMARALHVAPGWFFEEFPPDEGRPFETLHVGAAVDPLDEEAHALAVAYMALQPAQRRAVKAVLEQFEQANAAAGGDGGDND